MVANGDEEKLVSSDFDLVRQPQPAWPLTAPAPLVVANGQGKGELLVISKGSKDARSSNFMITADPVTADSNWMSFSSTRKRIPLKTLKAVKAIG